MALVAPDGRMLLVNEALCRLLGRSTEALLAAGLADLIPADQQPLAATLLAPEPAGDQPRQVEIATTGLTVERLGTDQHVRSARRHRAHPGHRLHYQDITERRLAEDQLAASERRFRSLVQNVSETVSLMDVAGGSS